MQSLQKNLYNYESGPVLYETMFVWNEYLTRGIRNNLKNTLWTVALVYGFFKQVWASEEHYKLKHAYTNKWLHSFFFLPFFKILRIFLGKNCFTNVSSIPSYIGLLGECTFPKEKWMNDHISIRICYIVKELLYSCGSSWGLSSCLQANDHKIELIIVALTVYPIWYQVKLSASGRDFRLTLIARRSRHYAGTR